MKWYKNLAWIVNFKESAKKELSKLDKPIAKKLVIFLQQLSNCDDPRHKGKQLKGKLKDFWRYRVSDYRIITKITDQEITILVLKVAHRKDVYEDQ